MARVRLDSALLAGFNDGMRRSPRDPHDDPEIRHAARFLVRKYGAEADMAVARYAETFLVKGELENCTFVARVLGAIMALRRTPRRA